jgi:IS30 family transposase
MISERPAEAADRAVPGHWEGDLIMGAGSSAIGTRVERSTRLTMLLRLPRMGGMELVQASRTALRLRDTAPMRSAMRSCAPSPPCLTNYDVRSPWDHGAEMAQHARLSVDAGAQAYFCDPQSPWQPGTNENTNGLLGQYIPKRTDLIAHDPDALAAVAAPLNARPRKARGLEGTGRGA